MQDDTGGWRGGGVRVGCQCRENKTSARQSDQIQVSTSDTTTVNAQQSSYPYPMKWAPLINLAVWKISSSCHAFSLSLSSSQGRKRPLSLILKSISAM